MTSTKVRRAAAGRRWSGHSTVRAVRPSQQPESYAFRGTAHPHELYGEEVPTGALATPSTTRLVAPCCRARSNPATAYPTTLPCCRPPLAVANGERRCRDSPPPSPNPHPTARRASKRERRKEVLAVGSPRP